MRGHLHHMLPEMHPGCRSQKPARYGLAMKRQIFRILAVCLLDEVMEAAPMVVRKRCKTGPE